LAISITWSGLLGLEGTLAGGPWVPIGPGESFLEKFAMNADSAPVAGATA